ncbi:hypothetical protein XENOCAPTIV_028097 [Xenoophorus captivus]|uniref:Uncharacterized protein n=1 Tax=Xenoophorus captivus TaxID=1517983 RepID=A0ABV0RM93_9TELE
MALRRLRASTCPEGSVMSWRWSRCLATHRHIMTCLFLSSSLSVVGLSRLICWLPLRNVVYVLDLAQELVRLESQMQKLARCCRLREGLLPDELGDAGDLKKLRRSRRNQEGHWTQTQDQDKLRLMTYSVVPVR